MKRFTAVLSIAALSLGAGVTGSNARRGGQLAIAQRSSPRTLNPVVALDGASREVIERTTADLVHINRVTDRAEPMLASRWVVEKDGRTVTFWLRPDVRFSDGHPFDADDVVFSFAVYLDERLNSPLRASLLDGNPIAVTRLDRHVVRVTLPTPRAAAERMFDSVPMLPRHLLEPAYRAGRLDRAWALDTPVNEMAGLGPFTVKRVVAGDRIVLTRNPHYWKRDAAGEQLPYLDQLTFFVVAGEEGQVARFVSGDADVLNRLSSDSYEALARRGRTDYLVEDVGPSLEYHALVFNNNRLGAGASRELWNKQLWFRDVRFRQAVSAAIDRQAIARLAYGGRATAIWSHVTTANWHWFNERVPRPPRSVEHARQLLTAAGFRLDAQHRLRDAEGRRVAITLLVQAGNPERTATAVLVQADLAELGIDVQLAPMEFRALLDRVLRTRDYDATLLALGGGDTDPISEMNVWLTTGSTHVWNLPPGNATTEWEVELDDLMRRQSVTLDEESRKAQYDRVQVIVAEKLPLIPLVSPNVLVAARTGLEHFRPIPVQHYTLWNVDELFWRQSQRRTIP
jgi:peptide/nickel transport system substrate-binding protein